MKRFVFCGIALFLLFSVYLQIEVTAQITRRSHRHHRSQRRHRASARRTTRSRTITESETGSSGAATLTAERESRSSSRTRPPCATDLASCPDEGCGGPDADLLLNRSKNRTESPSPASVRNMTLNDLRHLSQPASWQPNRDRSSLQGTGREGQPVRAMGYLWRAKREHAESCNCGLDAPGAPGELLTDIHMVLTDNMSDPEATSVTAEITPRVRALRPDPQTWTASQIALLRGKFIRVTGYVMLDTQHIGSPLVRATNWEVHPITKLEVCTRTESQCRAGQGWQEVQ